MTHLKTHYDYESVMHFEPYTFSVDPDIPTVIPKDPDAKIGQRTHLTDCDIVRLQMLYGCIEEVSHNSQQTRGVHPMLF